MKLTGEQKDRIAAVVADALIADFGRERARTYIEPFATIMVALEDAGALVPLGSNQPE